MKNTANLRKEEQLMAEGYLEMAQESLAISHEWEAVNDDWE